MSHFSIVGYFPVAAFAVMFYLLHVKALTGMMLCPTLCIIIFFHKFDNVAILNDISRFLSHFPLVFSIDRNEAGFFFFLM